MKKHVLLACILSFAALLFLGCGGPKNTFSQFVEAVKNKDADKSWELLCKNDKSFLNKQFENSKSSTLLGKTPENIRDGKTIWTSALSDSQNAGLDLSKNFSRVEVIKEEVTGDSAQVTYKKDGVESTAELIKENGDWKISLPLNDLRMLINSGPKAAFIYFIAAIVAKDADTSWELMSKATQDSFNSMFEMVKGLAAMSPEGAKQIEGVTDGKGFWKKVITESDSTGGPDLTKEFANVSVYNEEVNGNSAILTVVKNNKYDKVEMLYENGSWKVDLSKAMNDTSSSPTTTR